MRAPSSIDRRRPRPRLRLRRHRRASARGASVALVLLLAAAPGCGLDPPEVREGKAAIEAFLRDLRAHDATRLRARATCLVPTEGIRDARLRHVEPIHRVTILSLDSLVERYGASQREAESAYTRTPDDDPAVEERFQTLREWGRRAEAVRAARRAAEQSARSAGGGGESRHGERGNDRIAAPHAPPAPLLSIRAHVMVQYAGPAVGPDRIERDVIVRLLRAPGGAWVVYAFDPASDPPGPIPF